MLVGNEALEVVLLVGGVSLIESHIEQETSQFVSSFVRCLVIVRRLGADLGLCRFDFRGV